MTFDYLSPREAIIFRLLHEAREKGASVSIREIQEACKPEIGAEVSLQNVNVNMKYLASKLSMNSAPWRIVRESKPRGRGNTGVFKLETNP